MSRYESCDTPNPDQPDTHCARPVGHEPPHRDVHDNEWTDPTTDLEAALRRARRAMDAALLRDTLAERTSVAALVRTSPGVPHNPACTPHLIAHIDYNLTAYRALYGGKLPPLAARDTPPH